MASSRSRETANNRFEELDVLRGLAAIAVVFYHCTMHCHGLRSQFAENPQEASIWDWLVYLMGCGYLGVPVFFVISGYCICSAAVRQRDRGLPGLRFFRRRFQRIYPTYWICLALFLAVCWVPFLGINVSGMSISQWAGNLFLFEQWRPNVFGPPELRYINAVAWTLCYEEQFYLLVGLMLLAWPRGLFIVFGFLTAFCCLYVYGRYAPHLADVSIWIEQNVPIRGFVYDENWLFFASGIALYRFRESPSLLRYLFFGVFAALILWELRQMDWASNRFQSRVVAFSSTVLLGVVSLDCAPRFSGRLKQFGIWLGDRTYSIYLIHLPICLAVVAFVRDALEKQLTPETTVQVIVPVGVVLSVIAGAVFFHFVESHFLPRREQIQEKPAI